MSEGNTNIKELLEFYVLSGVDETCGNAVLCLPEQKSGQSVATDNVQPAVGSGRPAMSPLALSSAAAVKNADDLCREVRTIDELRRVVEDFDGCSLKYNAKHTVIGDGCRIDNLVQIAHNDKLGRGCVLVSQVGVAGSCTFGDYVVCGGQAGFADHIKVGSGAQVGAKSGIMRDIEPGQAVMGIPAIGFKDFMKQTACIQKLWKK